MKEEREAHGSQQRRAPEAVSVLTSVVARLNDLKGLVERIELPRRRRTLSYDEVFTLIYDNRPGHETVVGAAILRTALPNGRVELAFVYVDETDGLLHDHKGVPYGGRVTVDAVDEELADMFGDTDLILIR